MACRLHSLLISLLDHAHVDLFHRQCWHADFLERPTFRELATIFPKILVSDDQKAAEVHKNDEGGGDVAPLPEEGDDGELHFPSMTKARQSLESLKESDRRGIGSSWRAQGIGGRAILKKRSRKSISLSAFEKGILAQSKRQSSRSDSAIKEKQDERVEYSLRATIR